MSFVLTANVNGEEYEFTLYRGRERFARAVAASAAWSKGEAQRVKQEVTPPVGIASPEFIFMLDAMFQDHDRLASKLDAPAPPPLETVATLLSEIE
jgi:hypothetical protein